MKEEVKEFMKEIRNKEFLKSISALMVIQAVFFAGIKLLPHHYHYIPSVMDSKIPFIPYIVHIYNLFYPFIFICFYYIFCKDKKSYIKGIIAGIIGFLICDIFFLIYPVAMIRPEVSNLNVDAFTRFMIKLTYAVDNPPNNCFPSIHALFCFQLIYTTFVSKNISKKIKIPIIVISLAIAFSTLFVKQHYFYDIVAALFLCIMCNIIVCIIEKKKNSKK